MSAIHELFFSLHANDTMDPCGIIHEDQILNYNRLGAADALGSYAQVSAVRPHQVPAAGPGLLSPGVTHLASKNVLSEFLL